MTAGFVFWNNLASETLNLDEIRERSRPSTQNQRFELKKINDRCGLAYWASQLETEDWAENDTTIVYCPGGQIEYKQYAGISALRALLDSHQHNNQLPLKHIRNGFAIVVFDKTSGEIAAAIDKFGIARLYYANIDGATLISNSLSTLVAALPDPPAISDQAIYHFIDAHIIPSPLTAYKNIFKLEPAQTIRIKGSNIRTDIYWQPQFNESLPSNLADLQEETRRALSQGVNHCGIDDTTGAFLSGGLDSSTVAGYMARNNPDKTVATYTMGFAEAGYDETEFAEIAARHFGTNLRHYYVTPDDVAAAFSHVIGSCDEPFGNSSIIPAYLCARFAHGEGITTMLAGDGGDELFAGNERYAKQQVFEHYAKVPSLLRKTLLEPMFLNGLPHTRVQPFAKIKSYIEQAVTPMPDRMERYNFINHFGASAIFNHDFLASVDPTLPITQKREVYNRLQHASMLNRMLYMDWKFTLADNDLVKVNTACDLAGVAVKYPMLDDELVELSTRIPSALKIQNGELRSFYKASLKDFLPDEIINKQKHGFGLPFGEWLKKSPTLQEKMYDNLANLKTRNYVEANFVDNIIETHRTQNAASFYGTMVWILAVLEEWLTSRKH